MITVKPKQTGTDDGTDSDSEAEANDEAARARVRESRSRLVPELGEFELPPLAALRALATTWLGGSHWCATYAEGLRAARLGTSPFIMGSFTSLRMTEGQERNCGERMGPLLAPCP